MNLFISFYLINIWLWIIHKLSNSESDYKEKVQFLLIKVSNCCMIIIGKNRKLVIYIGQYESIFMITNRANNGYKKRTK